MSPLVSTKNDALQLCVTAKDKDIRPALSAAFRELIRAQRHGFTDDASDLKSVGFIMTVAPFDSSMRVACHI